MITIKQYSDDQKQLWDSFCNSSKNPLFMFNRNYMEYHKDRFVDNSLLFFDDDILIALLPMSIKDNKLYSHGGLTYGGFIIDNSMKQHKMNELFDCLIQYAKEHSISSIIYKTIPHVYHIQPAEEDRSALFIHNAKLLKIEPSTVLDLQTPLKMPKGRKAQISRAKREGVTISDSTDFNSFIAIENAVLEEYHNTKAVHTGEELQLLHSYFPEKIHLFAASYQDKMIAGTVVFEYDTVIHTQYMAANEIAREIGALDYTISYVMEKYKDSKKWLDFGISSEDGGRILNEGLVSQKEGFGGRTNIYSTWELSI